MAQVSGINRGFMWLRKVLQITEETESPSVLSEIVRPTMDVFGWDRLAQVRVHDNSGAAAPASTVNAPITPNDVLRVVFHASVRHTDTGVDHLLWIDKLEASGGGLTGITTSNLAVPVGVDQGTDRWIFLEPGTRLRGRADIALVAGALAIDLNFIDLPIGEYIA